MATRIKEPKQTFITWTDDDGNSKALAFQDMYAALQKVEPIRHSSTASDVYRNIYPDNTSIRDEFTVADYENYRPSERMPNSPKGRIKASMEAYYNHGIIRHVIDLMGDFTTQGIDVVHPKRKVQAWYKKWFKLVGGKERTERLANYLARTANVIIKRKTGKLTLKQNQEFYKTTSGPTDKVEPPVKIKLEKREIPTGYSFYNPLTIDISGNALSTFVDSNNPRFTVTVPNEILSAIQYPKTQDQRDLIAQIPPDILNLIRKGNKQIPLDPKTTIAVYYKKDDWESWACPIIASILPDLKTLEKLKLADRAALDGVISQVRLWKLGSLEYKIIPNQAVIEKLASVLVNGVGGGIVDLIWGPDIELLETTTSLHNFLGETKYTPVLNAIYAGLGIPPLFTGASNQGSFTNNFLAIKALIEQLQYIRERIIEFWENEIILVQKAMGFTEPASLVFDRMTLNDESSILQLITGLVDRNIISDEYAQEMVGAIPEIEAFRIKREDNERKSNKKPRKASPYHSPMTKEDYTKLFIQQGTVTPGQVDLELNDPKPDEKTLLDQQQKHQTQLAKLKPAGTGLDGKVKKKPVGKSGQGRPLSKKDSKKRKQKQVKPRRSVKSFIQTLAWAESAQDYISDVMTPIFLKAVKKSNLRQLTSDEFKNFEKFKFAILANLPEEEITEATLKEVIKKPLEIPTLMTKLLDECINKFKEKTNNITVEQTRKFQSAVYATYNCKQN